MGAPPQRNSRPITESAAKAGMPGTLLFAGKKSAAAAVAAIGLPSLEVPENFAYPFSGQWIVYPGFWIVYPGSSNERVSCPFATCPDFGADFTHSTW